MKNSCKNTTLSATRWKGSFTITGKSPPSHTHLVYSQERPKDANKNGTDAKKIESPHEKMFEEYVPIRNLYNSTDNKLGLQTENRNRETRLAPMVGSKNVPSSASKHGEATRQKAASSLHAQEQFHINKSVSQQNTIESVKYTRKLEQSAQQQKPPSGILSDSDRKQSRKDKPRQSIAFNLDSNQQPKKSEQESIQGIISSNNSILELSGDVTSRKQDLNFSKMAGHVNSEVSRIKESHQQNYNGDLVTIESRSSLNSNTEKQGKEISIHIIEPEQKSSAQGPESNLAVFKDSQPEKMSHQHSLGLANILSKSRAMSQKMGSQRSSSQLQNADRKIRQSMHEKRETQQFQSYINPSRMISNLLNSKHHSSAGIPVSPSRNEASNDKYTIQEDVQQRQGTQKLFSESKSLFTSSKKFDGGESPRTGRSAMERRLHKYDELLAQNTHQMKNFEITNHVYTRRNERILKEKYVALAELEQKIKTKAYVKQLKVQQSQTKKLGPKQHLQLPGVKPSVQFLSPKMKANLTKYSFTQRSSTAMKKFENQISSEKKNRQHMRSFEPHFRSNPFITTPTENIQQSHLLTQPNVLQMMPIKSRQVGTIPANDQGVISPKEPFNSLYGTLLTNTQIIKSKDVGGSSLFKTASSKNSQLNTAHSQLALLTMDTAAHNQYRKQKDQIRGGSQPHTSIKEDLEDTQIKFKIADQVNPAGLKRPLKTRQPGSSLPSQLVLRDPDGKANIQTLQKIEHNITVDRLDEESSDAKTVARNGKKILILSNETKKQNQFLDKFVHLHRQAHNELKNGAEKLGSSDSQTTRLHLSRLAGADITVTTENLTDEGLLGTSSKAKSSKKKKSSKSSFATLENQLNLIAQAGAKSGNVNIAMLHYINKPQVVQYPDYPKMALMATRTEIKTLLYELKRCMNSQAMIQTLESTSTISEVVKNENIELIPRLPIQCKVSIKERIAPIKLKFEFFDSQTAEKLKNPDTVVCLSATVPCPTVETAQHTLTNFSNPVIRMFTDIQGKVIPEFNPSNKKDKFPQQVYISLQSMTGCFCTVSVSFPNEKRQLAEQQNAPTQQLMRAKTMNSQSQEASRFAELKLINQMRDFSYRKAYKLNTNFIKEEIQKCSDQANYVCEAMKQAEVKRKEKRLIRKQQRQKNEIFREENKKLSLQNFIERTKRMQTSASQNNLPHASEIIANTQLLLQTVQGEKKLDAVTRETHRALQQSYKRGIMMLQAQELRQQQQEDKKKHRLLSLIRWDLIRAYRHNLERTYAEENLQRQVVKKFIVFAKIWRIILKVKDLFDQMKTKNKLDFEKERSSRIIQRAFRRLLSNSIGKRGSSIQDRMLYRVVHGNALFSQFIKDQTYGQAKVQLVNVLEAMSSRYQLESRIRSVTRSAMILKRNWIQYKFSYVLRQALLKARMEQQIQEWSKKACKDKKLITKPERSEILNSYARMHESPRSTAIAQKNLVLFSKMIKYECMINNFYFRIEKEAAEATKMLRQLNKEEAEEIRRESPQPDSIYEEEESCASSPETETQLQRRRRLRKEYAKRLENVTKLRQSSFLSATERIYDEVVKEVCKIGMDRANFAVFCWEGMEGHEEIKKRAKQHMVLRKKNAQSSKANKLDAYEKNYRKGQAKIVKDAFSSWIKQRREDFFKTLRKSSQTMDFSNWKLKTAADVPSEALSGQFFMPGRPTQPQELSFMFMKIMDEVYAQQEGNPEKRQKVLKSKKIKDVEKEKEKEKERE